MATLTDLQRAYSQLSAKQSRYAELWRYYDGDHPLVYVNQKLHEIFKGLSVRWTENWCSVVIDALLDRIDLSGFTTKDETISAALADLWDEEDLALESEETHRSVAVTGEGFVIVEEDEEGKVRPFANPSHLCHMLYRNDNPKVPGYAAKWWQDDEYDRTHLTLYYPDRFEHYIANSKLAEVSDANAFAPDPETPVETNTYKAIPVFHYRLTRRRPLGELKDVVTLQNANNKLFADMMVSAEFGAFKQRYVLGHPNSADLSALKNAPNEIWKIPGGDGEGQNVSVGAFDATDLTNYTNALDHIANRIAVLTRTPKHYLLQQGGDPSGEALLAMEAPLVKKATKYTTHLGVTWRQAMAFALALNGTQIRPNDIEPVWCDPETVQPLTQSEIRKRNRAAGIPIRVQLKREGWSDEELAELDAEDDAQAEREARMAEASMTAARRRFDQGDDGTPYSA